MERLGWKFHRIWSTNWFRDPDSEIDRLVEAYEVNLAHVNSAGTGMPVVNKESNYSAPLHVRQPEIQRSLSSFNVYGKPITQVSKLHLNSCMKHVLQVNGFITRDEAIEEARKALGYARKGPSIVSILGQTYDRVSPS